MRFSELKAIIEGKSFKRNQEDDANDKKKQDKQRRDAREEKKNQPVEEGKSFKRNKDEDADDKKKQDKQRRDSRDNKKQPVEESSDIKKGAFHKWLGKPEDEKITVADINKGLKSKDAHVRKMAQFAKNMEESTVAEGKSFKRNDDEGDVKQKRKEDQKRRDAREEKKNQPVEEGKSFKRNKDEDADDKKKQDKQKRDNQKGKQERTDEARTTFEGKSFKRNRDEDADDKKKQDQNRRKEREDKRERTDESVSPSSILMLQDHGYEVEFIPPHFRNNGDMDEQYAVTYLGEYSDYPDVIGKSYDREEAWDIAMEHFKQHKGETESSGMELGEAADISFNDAKAQMPEVKHRLSKMSGFHPDYVKTKAYHDKLQDRLARNGNSGDDELDEADISFNDAKRELPQVKHSLSKMSPFHPDYKKTKMRHDALQDRLARNGSDDDLNEATSASNIFVVSPEGEVFLVANEKLKRELFKYGYSDLDPREDYNIDIESIGEPFDSLREILQNFGTGQPADDGMEESYVSNTSGYGGDSMDVCEDGEEHDHEVGEDVCVCAGKYKGMEGKVIKIGPGPYKVVQLKGGKQVRLENSEMKCAASESYVSGDSTSGSDDVIEDLNMEDFVVPRDEAKGLADEVETKKNGKPVSSSEIERMKQLAGLNKI